MEAYCASGTAVSLGARLCSDVQAACSKRAADLRACASQNCANRALALSREEAQHARLRRARAPPRWLQSAHTLWKPTAPAGRPSRSVRGRASACEPRAPNEQLTCVRAQVRTAPTVRALSLSGGSAARALATCARPAALVGVGSYPMKPTAPAGRPSPSVHGRAPTCEPRAPNEQLTCVRAQVRTAPTARARSLSGRSVARALATCAHPAALVGVGPLPMKAHCTSGTAVSLGARPCFDVRAACSKRAADLRACASQNCANRARSLSLGRKRSTRACDVRAPRRAGCSRPIPYESLLRQRHGRLPRCTAVLRRASRVLQTSS